MARRGQRKRPGQVVRGENGRIGEITGIVAAETPGECLITVTWADDQTSEDIREDAFFGSNKVDWNIQREEFLAPGHIRMM